MPRVRAPQPVDNAQIIRTAADVREEVAHPGPALAVLLELPRRRQQISRLTRHDPRLIERQWLAVITREQRLVVESIDLARPPMHEQENHTLRLRREMRRLGRKWILLLGAGLLTPPPFPQQGRPRPAA